MIVANTL